MTHNRAGEQDPYRSRGYILVADDDQMMRAMLAQELERQGHTVALATDGPQTLEMLQAESFDLLLLDIVMPEMDGRQVLGHIKSDSALRDIPVIVTAARGELESAIQCIEMGAEDYLHKPFDPVLLRARIGASLEKKRLRDQRQAYLEQLQVERDAVRRRNRALALLNRLGQQFSTMLEVQQITEHLPRAIARIVNAEGASLWLRDEKREGWLVCRAIFHPGLKALTPADLRLRPGQGVAGWVVQHDQSVIVPDVYDDPRFFPGVDERTDFRTTSLLAVPLRIHYAVIGVIEVVNKLQGAFDTEDLSLIEALATSAAIAIDNAVLFDARRQLGVELKARNEELDAFAHTVAHDLKDVLNNIVGHASWALDSHGEMPAEELCASLEMISQNGQKMAAVVNELLLLASMRKVETVEMRPLDMADIVAQAQERLAFVMAEHQAEIVLPSPGTWPVAWGYGPWVEEVWVNYLSNALKYGGRPPRVELGFDEPASHAGASGAPPRQPARSYIRFWVRDNGPGLAPEEQARLFAPFERLDQVRVQGHGLGLSIVRRIVERLGGQVGVESQVGQGSTFSFTLPGTIASGR
jgi:signal transduction histidine kinase